MQRLKRKRFNCGSSMAILKRFDCNKLQIEEFLRKNQFSLQLEKEINTLQETQSTEQIYSEQLLKSRDDIKKLENQLEVVQKRCGEAMSENTNLRGSIDHLLLERCVLFYKLFLNTNFLGYKRHT